MDFEQVMKEDCLQAPLAVKDQLSRLLSELDRLIGEEIIGIYLHGSLAMGDFHIESSDIDLLVMVKQELSLEEKQSLADLLLKHSLTPSPIEVSVLVENQLCPWTHPCQFAFHYGEPWRSHYSNGFTELPTKEDPDLAAHIFVLHSRGVVLSGPAISSVFPEIPTEDFLDSILGDLDWSLDQTDQVYSILNHCRTYAYLSEEKVLSKGEGGEWMLKHVPDQFLPIVEGAIAAYRLSKPFQVEASCIEAFLRWIRGRIEVMKNEISGDITR